MNALITVSGLAVWSGLSVYAGMLFEHARAVKRGAE